VSVRFRPLQDWPVDFSRRRASGDPFRAPWSATLDLLERELSHLDARSTVIEIAVDEGDIRLDGWPRSNARPRHPGVILSFDSKHGPLRYGTDAFPRWQSNLRAIALGLESLRRVDRYGIGKRGEQYQGWKALPAGEGDLASKGRRIIEEQFDGDLTAAIKATHPDRGGDAEEFRAIMAARS
jgi:hypothetical protein